MAASNDDSTYAFLKETKARNLGARLLLVEDGADTRTLLTIFLKQAGFAVDCAQNGEIATRMSCAAQAASEPYDLILMDMQMPVLDGYEATRKLRATGYARPIIALTAHSQRYDRRLCLEAGCDDYLTKPVGRRRLVQLILSQIEAAVGDGQTGG